MSSGYHGCKSAAGYNAHMQAVFVSIDRNEDGAICRNELRDALVASNVPQTPDHEATLDAMRRIRSETAAPLWPQGPQQRAWPWPSR